MNLHSYRENHHQNFQVNFIYVRKLLTEKGMWKVLFIFAHWGQWLYLWFVSMNSLSLFWLHSNFLFIILFFFNYYLKVFFFLYCLHGQSNFALSNLRQIFVVCKTIQMICTRCESGLPFAVLQNVAYVNKQNSSVYHQ